MATIAYNPLVVAINVTAGTPQTYTLTRPVEVIDFSAYVTTPAAVATSVRLSSTTPGNISNSVSLGNNVAGQVGRAAGISTATKTLAAGGGLTVTQTGAATASRCFVTCVNVP
jgi:hypothetical protein